MAVTTKRAKQHKGAAPGQFKDKERIFKGLTQLFACNGFKVRREELKRGPGWAVSSGCCRKMEEKLVFVDRRTPLDDQIAFLVQSFIKADLVVQESHLLEMPADVRAPVAALFESSMLEAGGCDSGSDASKAV